LVATFLLWLEQAMNDLVIHQGSEAPEARGSLGIGVLALQGGVEPHLLMLRALGLRAQPVVSAQQLLRCDGLVLPGGESTVQRKLLARYALTSVLDAFVQAGKPVLATCAGLILAAERRYLDVRIERNAYGSQLHSFEALLDGDETEPNAPARRLSFIRAPRITALAPHVRVLATLSGEPVAVEQGRVIGTSGHPELTGEAFLHARAFVSSAAGSDC
jgi:5'-phosphate synthase pdxT subunit